MELTVEQYRSAITEALNEKQRQVLFMLRSFPNARATARQLAEMINLADPAEIVASGHIGRIGKTLSKHTGMIPPNYRAKNGDAPAYFQMVGIYTSNGGDVG